MRDEFGQPVIATAKDGVSLVPEARSAWSSPVQTEVRHLADLFAVTEHHTGTECSAAFDGSSATIRLENDGRVYVSVQAHGHGSYLKSVRFEWDEFVRRLGQAMFGDDWDNRP